MYRILGVKFASILENNSKLNDENISLPIGNIIIKDIDSNKLKYIVVMCKSGRTISLVGGELCK